MVTLHVSVWVEMAWAEILNVIQIVTLHVSVWVEIRSLRRGQDLWWKSRSTWACELKSLDLSKIPINHSVTLHVSVWVEMEPFGKFSCIGLGHAPRERVSWNDFLKGVVTDSGCHAPRERVSWNSDLFCFPADALVTLHVSVWVEILGGQFCNKFSPVTLHVSVWVEMIFIILSPPIWHVTLHVSVWVEIGWRSPTFTENLVTLHVSVWVEIYWGDNQLTFSPSRSTWACELKLLQL